MLKKKLVIAIVAICSTVATFVGVSATNNLPKFNRQSLLFETKDQKADVSLNPSEKLKKDMKKEAKKKTSINAVSAHRANSGSSANTETSAHPESKTDSSTKPKEETTPSVPTPYADIEPSGIDFSSAVAVKDSTVDTPLAIGEWGCVTALTTQFWVQNGAVRLDKIYTGTEAQSLVEQYQGRKKKPSEGTAFAVCEYSTTTDPKTAYLDSRFLGLNGEKLVLRGVSYPMRTYDLKNAVAEGDLFTHQYIYYEVPTGCPEYILSFGYRTKTGCMANAFYKVSP